MTDASLPAEVVAHASTATPGVNGASPFHVDDWTRANPMPST